MAKTMGFSPIERTIPGETAPATERPINTSAPAKASLNVRASVSRAYSSFHSFMFSMRPL